MKTAALLVLVLALPAAAIEVIGDKVTLTDEDRETLKNCATQGGCKVWSQDEIRALLMVFRARLVESGSMCRRDFL
jgi:hypothetical protein